MVNEPQEHVTTTEARAGADRPMVRHVLVIGSVLVIVLFLFLFILG